MWSRRGARAASGLGASMGLVHAGDLRWPVAGVIAMAPFVDVEGSNAEAILSAADEKPVPAAPTEVSAEALVEQMNKDVERAKEICGT